MKKFIVFAVVLALLVPSLALATEFTLGGFIKLDAFWDSVQQGKNMNGTIGRNNDPNLDHGRLKFTAQGSRFNFTIKGPDLWGAKTTGYIEMDFDINEQGATTAAGIPAVANTASASNNYAPRLRHAMFRFNWPETELLFGQYWSMFCEWYPELAEDGPFQTTGIPTARIPQIRFTQQFLGWGTASVLVGSANTASNGQVYSTFDTSGQSTATPQVQGKLQYAQDLWGKAAYYGKPTPFTAQVVAGWQRSGFAQNFANATYFTFGQNTWSNFLTGANTAGINLKHTTLNPWMVMGTAFIPVIPTHSANLTGTASLLANWWIGAGVDSFGMAGATNPIKFNDNNNGIYSYNYELEQRFGGFVQGQYYFNNEWNVTVAYGMSRVFGLSQSDTNAAAARGLAAGGINAPGYVYAFNADASKLQQQLEGILWYRPIQAIKFGLEYAYGQTTWFQSTGQAAAFPTGAVPAVTAFNATPVNTSNVGNAHRVEFVGFFYF
ncbi:MAG: hypothetical protein WBV23_03500 [Desulfobaccales bacterium]